MEIIHKIHAWLDRLQPSESVVLGAVSVIVGITSAAGVWLFKRLIDLAELFYFDTFGAWLGRFSTWTVVLVPAVGGLVVGAIVYFFIDEERHQGIAGIMEAVALAGGRLRYKRIPVKAVASALSS